MSEAICFHKIHTGNSKSRIKNRKTKETKWDIEKHRGRKGIIVKHGKTKEYKGRQSKTQRENETT